MRLLYDTGNGGSGMKLKRSNDRKVANAVTKNGKQAAIANTFGLPAGKAYSCPGATTVCESICYAGKLEKIFPGVKKDGDFFNDTYAYAWKTIIDNHPDIQFWVYTRVKSAALILKDITNLSLYYSTDSENVKTGVDLKINHGIRLAYLAKNFAIGQADMKAMIGKPGAKCPENSKQIPLISNAGSACVSCKLCVYSKADIVFSSTKK